MPATDFGSVRRLQRFRIIMSLVKVAFISFVCRLEAAMLTVDARAMCLLGPPCLKYLPRPTAHKPPPNLLPDMRIVYALSTKTTASRQLPALSNG